MKLAILFPIILNVYMTSGQNINIGCIYGNFQLRYTCMITIFNPDGFNNFTHISGQHLPGMTDTTVEPIFGERGSVTLNFPSAICEIFRNLRVIDLSNAEIQIIDEESFSNCWNLRQLFLNDNKISRLYERSFSQNIYLEILSFINNEIEDVPEKIFENQQQLIYIALPNNLVSDFADDTFKPLSSLQTLLIDSNLISKLKHNWFETLVNLRILVISGNPIDELPEHIFNPLTSLTNFLATNMNLTIFSSESFGNHRSLNWVHLQNNQITAFDEQFIDNTGVSVLNMTKM